MAEEKEDNSWKFRCSTILDLAQATAKRRKRILTVFQHISKSVLSAETAEVLASVPPRVGCHCVDGCLANCACSSQSTVTYTPQG